MTTTINGRTPEEIKQGLECCALGECDNGCPYFEKMLKCTDKNMDALTLINQLLEDNQQLERERDEARNDLDALNYANTELHSAYEAMKRERDAAVEDIQKATIYLCQVCKKYHPAQKDVHPHYCEELGGYPDYGGAIACSMFEWRGIQEEV